VPNQIISPFFLRARLSVFSRVTALFSVKMASWMKGVVLFAAVAFIGYQTALLIRESKNPSLTSTIDNENIQPNLVSNDDIGVATPAWTLNWFKSPADNHTVVGDNIENSAAEVLPEHNFEFRSHSIDHSYRSFEDSTSTDDMMRPPPPPPPPPKRTTRPNLMLDPSDKTTDASSFHKNAAINNSIDVSSQDIGQVSYVKMLNIGGKQKVDEKEKVTVEADSCGIATSFDMQVTQSIARHQHRWSDENRENRRGIAFLKTYKCGSSTLGSILFR
jgi:hypothetical protein